MPEITLDRPKVVLPEGAREPASERPVPESAEVKRERLAREGRLFSERIEKAKKHVESKDGILESLPRNTGEMAIKGLDSKNENEIIFGVMAIELEARTQLQPIKEWTDDQRAREYEEWKQYSSDLDKERKTAKKKDTAEKLSNIDDRVISVEGIKKALLEGLSKDRAADILSGELLERGSKRPPSKSTLSLHNERPMVAEKVTRARADFETPSHSIVERKEPDLSATKEAALAAFKKKASSMSDDEQREALIQANFTEEEIAYYLGKTGDSRETVSSDVLAGIEVKRAREAKLTPEERTRLLRSDDDEYGDAIRARSESTYDRLRERNEKIEEAKKKEKDKEAKEEARVKWQREKEKMPLLISKRNEQGKVIEGVYDSMDVNEDWSKYGWSEKEKRDVIERGLNLEWGTKKAEVALKTFLINGKTAEETKELIKENSNQQGLVHEHFLKNFVHDEVLWKVFGLEKEYHEVKKRMYENEDVDNMQTLAWQIGHIYPDTFGENQENATWERRIRYEDEEGRRLKRVVEKTGDNEVAKWYYVDSEGRFVDKNGEKLDTPLEADQVRFKIHEHVRLENMVRWLRYQINWLQYKDENGKWDAFQAVELPGKKGFVHSSLIKMLDAKETVFASSREEGVPEQILKEVEKKHGIEDGRLSKMDLKEDYRHLSEIFEVEAYFIMIVRQMHLNYMENYADEGELPKAMAALLSKSHLTKPMWGGRPLWQFMSLMPKDYGYGDNNAPMKDLDGVLGGSIIKNYLAYYYLSDLEMLREKLGEDAKLFDYDELRKTRNKKVDGTNAGFAEIEYDNFYDFSYTLRKENGVIKDKQGRIFTKDEKDGNVYHKGKLVIEKNGDIKDRELAKGIITGFNNSALAKAFTMLTDGDGNALIESYSDDRDEVRYKVKTKIDKGNERAFIKLINFFPEFTTNPEKESIVKAAIAESAASKSGEKLDSIDEEYANMIAWHLSRFTGAAARNEVAIDGFPPMADALSRMIHYRAGREKYIDDAGKGEGKAGKAGNWETMAEFKSILTEPMLAITSTAKDEKGRRIPLIKVFEELDKAQDKLREASTEEDKKKVKKEYRATAANKLKFDKQAERHYFDNTFQRALRINKKIKGAEGFNIDKYGVWTVERGYTFKVKEFQEDMTGFMQDIRYEKKSGRDLHYATEHRFWDYDLRTWRTMSVAEGQNGTQMVDIPEFKTNGKIDPEKIDKKSYLLYQQFFLTFIAGEIIMSRRLDKMAVGQPHEMAFYDDLITALSKIPGGISLDEGNMRNNKITKQFLSKERLKWLQEKTGTTRGKLYTGAFIKSLLLGNPKKKEEAVLAGLGEFFGLFLSNVIKK